MFLVWQSYFHLYQLYIIFIFFLISELRRQKSIFFLETSFFLYGGTKQGSLLSTFREKRIGLIFKFQQNGTDNMSQNIGRNPTYTTRRRRPQQQQQQEQQQSHSLNYVAPKARNFPTMCFWFSDGECEKFLLLFWSM
jgi:hypothetical protein